MLKGMMTDRSSFSVMTINLRFGLARDKENVWDSRKGLVGILPVRNKGDFIGFKEVFQHDVPGTCHGFTGNPGGKHIGWRLYRGGICARHSRVLIFHRGTRYPSAHFPVTAGFTEAV
ncbi:hypothetical protein [Desulfobacter curvatus]|uniref:hypothetical protein n=1 Tax=Desulfobacter curvatus TaxID=2290 RepID=UPI00036FC500|nr:hypothetical protein [Desulfobacter curvatus]